MKMTKILAISAFGIVLSACSSQQQVEEVAVPSTGPEHVHNVQGYGDFTHKHTGNSTASHGHSWDQIQREIKNK